MSGTALTGEEIDAIAKSEFAKGHVAGMAEMADKLLSSDVTTSNVLASVEHVAALLRKELHEVAPLLPGKTGELARLLDTLLARVGT